MGTRQRLEKYRKHALLFHKSGFLNYYSCVANTIVHCFCLWIPVANIHLLYSHLFKYFNRLIVRANSLLIDSVTTGRGNGSGGRERIDGKIKITCILLRDKLNGQRMRE